MTSTLAISHEFLDMLFIISQLELTDAWHSLIWHIYLLGNKWEKPWNVFFLLQSAYYTRLFKRTWDIQ